MTPPAERTLQGLLVCVPCHPQADGWTSRQASGARKTQNEGRPGPSQNGPSEEKPRRSEGLGRKDTPERWYHLTVRLPRWDPDLPLHRMSVSASLESGGPDYTGHQRCQK